MITIAAESVRELPVPAWAFGVGVFAVFSLLLYLVMRIGQE
jgi:hypothetical protein